MVSKRELIETYGEERDGKTVVICPHCADVSFESLEEWKDHMQELHGGYTKDEVSEGLSAPPSQTENGEPSDKGVSAGQRTPPTTPPKPKKLSAKARELNDKVNRCITLILKHLLSSISEEEREELSNSRAEITQAFIGVEFDFEDRLFSLEGKWAIIAVLLGLYLIPMVPNFKQIGEKIAAQQKAKKSDK